MHGLQKLGKSTCLFAKRGFQVRRPLAATTEGLYDELFDINAKGVYFTIQKALPLLNDGARSSSIRRWRAKSAW